jgi:tetratricopeptide (TPR) repeat protein
MLSQLGRYEEAIQDFNRALQINPKDKQVYRERGLAFFRQGQYSLAGQDFEKALL